ncbi:hypothetical protein DUNSADRAFT_16881 [Dunaliella salina]|uniref:Uncharacterized protein n=1 Tax=Dunaliella salina TaxID=3046 RepID=A0ABQ7H953_DUNSA|nr:hypothetical protein DUNSADRAFT_16881 [Dunaliella salina]|eukprot:KAF5843382.1 hypothetical protein DUNSADRAFT_16881 [Dunaliella salina]
MRFIDWGLGRSQTHRGCQWTPAETWSAWHPSL